MFIMAYGIGSAPGRASKSEKARGPRVYGRRLLDRHFRASMTHKTLWYRYVAPKCHMKGLVSPSLAKQGDAISPPGKIRVRLPS